MSSCGACSTIISSDAIGCDGVCGKVFHPKCLKRSASITNQYTCAECINIKPCHVLRLVKSIMDDFAANQAIVADNMRAFGSRLPGLEVISDDINAIYGKVDSLHSCVDEMKNDSNAILAKSHEVSSRVRLLSDVMDEMRDLPSTPGSAVLHQQVDPVPLVPLLNDIRSQIRKLKTDFTAWSSSPTPFPPSLPPAVPKDTTLTSASAASTSSAHTPSSSALTPSMTSTSEVGVQTGPDLCQPASATRAPLIRFGVSWTEPEWDRRLEKLSKSNPAATCSASSFFLHGAPLHADAVWVQRFLTRTYGFDPIKCHKLPSSKKAKNLVFKLSIPSKYAWLLTGPVGNDVTIGDIRISRNTGSRKSNTLSKPLSNPNTTQNRAKPLTSNTTAYSKSKKTPNPSSALLRSSLRHDPNWNLNTLSAGRVLIPLPQTGAYRRVGY